MNIVKHIDRETIRKALPYARWLKMVEKAVMLKEGKDYIMPERAHIDFDNDTLLVMPCISGNYFSSKIITLFPGNTAKGKERLKGLVILNDRNDGEALAILDGPSITAMRTAAVGGFAVRHLSPPGSSRLGIIGLGIQGLHQALFACSQREIGEITVFDKNEASYPVFSRQFKLEYPGITINTAVNSRQVCEKSDIIITATDSTKPVLPDDAELLEGKTIIGIGSYKKEMREFPDSLYSLAGKVYVDTVHGIRESGDLIHPLSKGILEKADILEAGDLLRGEKPRGSTRIFKSVGSALFDLLASVMVYETLYMQKK
ncbi:MAG: ornithine cyclodeaminase family protein [Bacteroidales bacterium]|nr:ornithine cyclodeaminase family protein [Bacteroidales bacterium]